ncbi:DUF3617 domain-containing protein [Ottowia sp.]|uniref:DUF3617 domain-containing protein n=1 Tax=Ottowia sp. TaxID=1898956 RepID=UPI002C6F021D|nr:DUF3617 domain-containing protein [Pseudomonadota bacterium]HOV20070.1 DUF3617 domain-containing protein [Ottowia sp.]
MRHALIALCALGALGTTGVAQAAGGPKAGLWETSNTRMELDGKDMLPDMRQADEQLRAAAAKMTPAQRQQAGAGLANLGTEPMSRRLCISAETAARDQPLIPRPSGAECETPKVEQSGNRTRFEIACKLPGGGTMTGKGETVAGNDLVTSNLDSVSTDAAGKRRTMLIETRMKYIGKDCGGVKPIEQQAQAQAPARAASAAAAPRAPAPRK